MFTVVHFWTGLVGVLRYPYFLPVRTDVVGPFPIRTHELVDARYLSSFLSYLSNGFLGSGSEEALNEINEFCTGSQQLLGPYPFNVICMNKSIY